MMDILQKGKGELVGWHDPDEAREWVRQNKSCELKDKRMSVTQAVQAFVHDGDFVADGGFGGVRMATSVIYEIIRQRKKELVLAAKAGVHDADLLIAAGCVDKVEVNYFCGHEMRGLSPASRRMVETGKCKVCAEISNAGHQWRWLAGMMGIPFIPSRNLLGTDTGYYSSSVVIEDPFTEKPISLIPAGYPDAAFIHVHRCDIYGNAQIDGSTMTDFELSRCARRLILTTEKIVSVEIIRKEPWRTVIPFFVVDAVVEMPYGSHPGEMPFLYWYDEAHFAEWLKNSRTEEGVEDYFNKYVYDVNNFKEYLTLCGGEKKMRYLKKRELYKKPMIKVSYK